MFRLKTTLAAMVTAGLCAGCSNPAVANPDYFSFEVEDGRLQGSYNAAGYSQDLVRTQAAAACAGGEVADYSEQPGPSGLVEFAATCSQGTVARRGFYEIERTPTGNFVVEAFTG